MSSKQREINRRLRILEHGATNENVRNPSLFRNRPRYILSMRKRYELEGEEGLAPKPPVGQRWPNQLSDEVVENNLHLRTKYHLGQQRIEWYLKRCHGIKVSGSSIYRTLSRNGLRRLPRNVGRRKVHTKRYVKRVPGHHI